MAKNLTHQPQKAKKLWSEGRIIIINMSQAEQFSFYLAKSGFSEDRKCNKKN